jgi:manganese efflux pump family protein
VSLTNILLIALGLAMDAFAVAAGAASGGFAANRRARFRLWFHFGLFQALMPVVGWLLGSRLAPLIAAWDHWVIFVLLAWIGGHMIRDGRRSDAERVAGNDPTRGRSLIMLSLATSLDALAVGFGFGCLGLSIWTAAAVIGLVTAAVSQIGCRLGSRLGRRYGPRAAVVGGVVLVAVGARILAGHLTNP